MRVAFVGKGGAGKTTLAAAFVHFLASRGLPVLAVDGDVNQRLPQRLGVPAAELPALGDHLRDIKDFLRGDNRLIPTADAMIKTTPPGPGSRLLTLLGDDWFHRKFVLQRGGLAVMSAGEFTEDDLGVSCFHGKTGGIELYLNHLLDGPREFVVADMTAGADLFASPLFTKFDLLVIACEPTIDSLDVYDQCQHYGKDFGLQMVVLANKVADDADRDFLRSRVDEPVAWFERSSHIRATSRGERFDLSQLEPPNLQALEVLLGKLQGMSRNWSAYQRLMHLLHERNVASWAPHADGQIDPTFELAKQL